ncbi:polyhomeotic-like protein 3 [Plectropomus leopardus]|uniref:polyhomeotic-like protein 3 n=1 Tax=Plectropomus leopardus TaxID=160734 RepID=UPI001C4C828F|nr:polyhomeotic-like protein 3 [Plectropomus leopardus]
MDRQDPGEKQAETNRTVATTPTTSAAVTMATASSGSTTCTQAPCASLSIISPDRQAVQVIQHAIHRPQSMAAQYLHQMYAAQQQHLMLQTAALHQHQHNPHLQSLATIQQASVCQRQSPSSSSGSLVHQPAGVSQNSITLPASPVTAQLIGRTQTSTGAATTISQQTMLLGNRPANCNQAQMYLRTQMLILTPAATVAAVQSDLPAVTSCSSLPTSSQVQNLALRAHLPGALAAAHSVILKPSTQTQAVTSANSLSKTSVCGTKTNQLTDTPTETGTADVTRLASAAQIITPAYSPVQTHALVKQQLSCPPGQRVAHHQLILQQATGGAPNHRQLQPIALRVAPPETNSSALPLSVKRMTTPSTQSQTNNDPQNPSCSSSSPPSGTSVFASSAPTSIPAATIQPQPPPLVAAPQRRTSFPQVQNQPPPPPPPLVLPRLPQNPPASLQRLSLHSVQAVAVQSGQVLLTEQELPVAEALVQMPYQNLPPPQTVAVNLKVHRVRQNETPSSGQTCKVNGLSSEERKNERSPNPQRDRSLTPLNGPPKQNGAAVMDSSSITSSRSVIRSPVVEEPSQLTTTSSTTTTTTTTSSSNPPPPSPPLPPLVLPAAVRGPSQPPSSPTSVPGSPDRIHTSHVLTHLIEGFVIREGLEPFPVVSSSLLADQQASLPESQEIQTNGDAAAEDSPLDADQSDSTDSEMDDDGPAADVAELVESVSGVLQCEFCGSRGYSHTFLRSKRFCSMACVRRFSVSCTKRITVLRAGRWGHRPMGRRGRPPSSRVNGASREHFLRQARGSFDSEETRQRSVREDEEQEQNRKEDEPPVPMTTRLRKQAERAREREKDQEREQERAQEREQEQTMTETISVSDGEEDEDVGCPSQWNVERVFSFINSLPGGQDVAEEFRSQEIDGQALLLLTEEHLVSTMNLKLGPALKLCAHINSLKDA